MTEAIDMSRFIEAKSDQLNSDDLLGAPRTVTITKVAGVEGDQPVAIYFEGDNGKPFKPCKTIRRVLVAIWGRYANDYVGRSITLYRDDAVMFGGLQVGGIRISHMSHLDKETVVVVAKSKGKKAGMKILPLADQPKPATEDKALAWADKLIATINTSAPDEVSALTTKHAATLEKMKKERPELYERVIAATVPVESDPFADDDGPTPAQKAAVQWSDEFDRAETLIDLKTQYAKSELDRGMMDDDSLAKVEKSYDDNTARLKPAKVEA